MVHYTFQHMSIITKLTYDVTQYYKEYYITVRCKYENTKIYINMNNTKDAHELQKENSREK